MPESLELSYPEIRADDAEQVAEFLAKNSWPFHGRTTPTLEEARQVKLGPQNSVRAFWIRNYELPIGLLRVFDLEDAETGRVQFDLRIAEPNRGHGIGRAAVAWMIQMLFVEYPKLHRIEGATRIDNLAMRRVLELNHFVLEGQLRQTWRTEGGTRYDTALYGRLRSDAS